MIGKIDIDKLNRVNKIVFKKFRKANDLQKQQMIKTLTDQVDNLQLLLIKMKQEL